MKTTFIAVLISAVTIVHATPELEKRVADLEKELTELKAEIGPILEKAQKERLVNEQRDKARARMRKDSEVYSRDELKVIENLYQVANKKWRSEEGKESLKTLIGTYDKANRTGCAILYLGQMSKGVEREKYLKQAIEDYSDCFYGDGVQVGAYARFYLAYHYKENGKADEAERLYAEIHDLFPNAIDHKGNLLSDLID